MDEGRLQLDATKSYALHCLSRCLCTPVMILVTDDVRTRLPDRAYLGYICRYYGVNPDEASLQLYRDKKTLMYFLGYLKERSVGRDHVSGVGSALWD